MPTPSPNETRGEWMQRCVPQVIDDGAADTQQQAVAICAEMWRNRDGNRRSRERGNDMSETKEFKSCTVKQMDEAGHGVAVFATLNVVDSDGDITEPGAFGEQDVMILPTHDWGHVPLGKGKTREEGDQALVDFKLNLDIEAARDWHSALKFDLANGEPRQEYSYGFTIDDRGEPSEEQRRLGADRILKRMTVHEVSPVLLGAGVGTRTVAVKDRRNLRLSEQIDLACRDAKAALDRAVDLRDRRRAEKEAGTRSGRADLSDDYYKQLDGLAEVLGELHAVAVELEKALHRDEPPDEPDHDVAALHARFLHTDAKLRGGV